MEMLQTLLDREIKDVITEYPETGTILADHGVGCVTCQVGTCLLKDIVAVHGLSAEEEQAVMDGIAAAAGGTAAATRLQAAPVAPAVTSGVTTSAGTIRYSPPIAQLVEEHRLIKRWVAQIPGVVAAMDLERAWDREIVADGIDFVRSYADHFHHAKEEDILFGYFDQEGPVVKAFLVEHEIARGHVREAEAGVAARDHQAVAEHLAAYGELLASHIKREDEVLYPWMDRELTTTQVGEIWSRFAAADDAAGPRFTKNYTALVERIERWAVSPLTHEEPATQKVQV